MKKLKEMRLHEGITALLLLALGIVILVWPDVTQQIIGQVIGGGLFLFGAIQAIAVLVKRKWHLVTQASLVLGIIIAVIGGWIFLRPNWILEMIPLMMGVVIILNGIHNLLKSLQLKKIKYEKWWVAIILGLLTIILGGVLIGIKDTAVQTIIRIIGIFLIYDAISDLWIVFTMHRAIKKLNVMRDEENIIDVDGIEINH